MSLSGGGGDRWPYESDREELAPYFSRDELHTRIPLHAPLYDPRNPYLTDCFRDFLMPYFPALITELRTRDDNDVRPWYNSFRFEGAKIQIGPTGNPAIGNLYIEGKPACAHRRLRVWMMHCGAPVWYAATGAWNPAVVAQSRSNTQRPAASDGGAELRRSSTAHERERRTASEHATGRAVGSLMATREPTLAHTRSRSRSRSRGAAHRGSHETESEEDEDGAGVPVRPLSVSELQDQFTALCPYNACMVQPPELCARCRRRVARRVLGPLCGGLMVRRDR